jgi:release factor glutamine methyltransferase
MEGSEASLLSLAGATRAEALTRVANFLARAGVEDSRRDARVLLLAAAQIAHAELLLAPERRLDGESAKRLTEYAARRGAREPVSRILGARGFWTLDLAVTPNVLDPRADTEALVELALRELDGRRGESITILDLGAGSGAIICALLSEFAQARALAVDRSASACHATKTNLARCGFTDRAHVLRGNWADAIEAKFDLVVSNPPYVKRDDIPGLAPEVRLHDPVLALDGGEDGLDCYRRLTGELPRLLAPGGLAVFEVGAGQASDVERLLRCAGLENVAIGRDAAWRERAIGARRERRSA